MSDRNEKHGPGHWRKGDPCYKVPKYLAESCASILWKVEIVINELRFLTEDNSELSVEGVTWFLLTAYSKMRQERDKLKKELLIKKEPECDDLEKSQPTHTAKK